MITVQYLSVSVRMQFRMIDYAMGPCKVNLVLSYADFPIFRASVNI